MHSVRETSVATEATYAVAATVGEQHVGISVTRQLDEAVSAAQTVRHAMLLAAAAGMAAALVLGLALSRRLIRRLRSLHDTALRVARLGLVVEMVPDARRDEIGDLQRAFATMQSRLREQEDARRTFVSTASHELRTPLASLRLMLDLAHEELECDPPDHREARREVERAAGQAERLSALADKLLDLSRIDAGVPAELRLLDVATIAGAVREFGARADAAVGLGLILPAATAAGPPAPDASLQLDRGAGDGAGGRIPPHFAGLSIEWSLIERYMGPAARPAFANLLANLGSGVLRIGGASQDLMPFDPAAPNTPRVITPDDLASIRSTLEAVDDAAGSAPSDGLPSWGVILGRTLDAPQVRIDGRSVAGDGSWPGFAPATARLERGRVRLDLAPGEAVVVSPR